jgi:hypothetical protein
METNVENAAGGVLIDIDETTGRALSIQRLNIPFTL